MIAPPPGAGWFAGRPVTELSRALRDGRLSPADLVERALAEAERLDPALNAFVTIDGPGARAAAERAGRELAAGIDRGPLHGVPVAVKDIVDTAGLRTTMGSRHFAGHVPARDAACVRRLRDAGAVIVGKTTTHEFAYGPTGDRSVNGASRNPYGTDRLSGGSSGGSAVAVAAGIVPLAVGTDTGGSVRIPAACCGIVGLKPTHGAIPTGGVFPVAPSLDTVGPMARTAEDCRLLWNALSGRDDGEPGPDPSTWRVMWMAPETAHPADPRVTEAARALLGPLPVREALIPDVAELGRAYAALQSAEVHAVHADRLASAPHLFDEEVLARLRAAGRVTPEELAAAERLRSKARSALLALLGPRDLLAMPTLPITAPPVGARATRIAGTDADVRAALLSLTSPWNVLGLPAVSVPAGTVDGLPVALQLVARPGGEALLLTAADHLSATDHPVPETAAHTAAGRIASGATERGSREVPQS